MSEGEICRLIVITERHKINETLLSGIFGQSYTLSLVK